MVSIPREQPATSSGSGFGFRGGQLELISIALTSFVAVVLALDWIQPSMRAAVWSGIAFPAGVLLGQMLPAAFARTAATPVIVFALTASTANAATQLFPHPAPAPVVAAGDDHHTPVDDSHVYDAPPAPPAPPPDAEPPCDPGPAIDRAHAIRIAAARSPHLDGELCGPDDHRYYETDLPTSGDLSFAVEGDRKIYFGVEDQRGRSILSTGLRRGHYFLVLRSDTRGPFSVGVSFRPSPP